MSVIKYLRNTNNLDIEKLNLDDPMLLAYLNLKPMTNLDNMTQFELENLYYTELIKSKIAQKRIREILSKHTIINPTTTDKITRLN